VETFCRIYDLNSHQLTVANGHATESFELNDTCDVWLESYKIVDPKEGRFGRQVLFDSEHAVLAPGTYSLSVDVPECAYQLDFAVESNRAIIDTVFRPDLQVCEEVSPTTTPTPTSSSSTTTSTTSSPPLPQNGVTTVPVVVLGETIYPSAVVGAAQQAPQGQLPFTGASIDVFAVVGVLSIVFGSRLRRRALTRRGGT
jgi:hypothetical protein